MTSRTERDTDTPFPNSACVGGRVCLDSRRLVSVVRDALHCHCSSPRRIELPTVSAQIILHLKIIQHDTVSVQLRVLKNDCVVFNVQDMPVASQNRLVAMQRVL